MRIVLGEELTAIAERIGRELDGSQGTNRARARVNQLGVDTDLNAVRAWIADRASSPATERAYLSEARRLMLWAIREAGKALADLHRADLEAYREFLADPQPASTWCGPKVPYLLEDGHSNPRWRPFVAPLTTAVIAQSFVRLNSLFDYLVETGYLDGNPLGGARRRAKRAMGERTGTPMPLERAIDQEQWRAVLETIEAMPRRTPGEQNVYERARYLVRVFYHLGARIGELATHTMGDFVEIDGAWYWRVTGKGGKDATLDVNDDLLAALRQYRAHLALDPLPAPGETTPILLSRSGGKPITSRQAYRIITAIFRETATRIEAGNPDGAAKLRAASPHWLRHATASHSASLAENMEELLAVQRHMRHSKLDTTLGYVHTEDAARRKVAQRLAEIRKPAGDKSPD